MGNLQWSYLHNLLAGLAGRARDASSRIEGQFRGLNTKGMTVTARGLVTAVDEREGARTATVDIWTEDEDGNKLLPGTALVQLD